ncbi:helix-turn-helix domain-containing protein [Flavobacterium sediminilitoris]|uniref:Helix-turn-helix domain-containing protein n=1 Tax=Flavobacterium sediminilitoris TaxID=2024526 RepID=A0ABY4HNF1_9FLAO|nr:MULTISPECIES: helix-turn-helix domain-containing protein [Flavobacterium]UOX34203.1 helix-turn-helix domain-containing protein [Flavobacterium sediminilitoris]
MKKLRLLTIVILFLTLKVNAQIPNEKGFEFYKEQFFQLQNKPDSALLYVNKIFQSKNDIDLAFAYTTKKYILTVTGAEFDITSFDEKIKEYLGKIVIKKENYKDLASIYILLGHIDKNNGKLDESIKKYVKAKEYALLNDDTFQLAKIKINIAMNLGAINLLDEAIKEIKEIRVLLEKIHDVNNYSFIDKYITNTLGSIYFRKLNQDSKTNTKYCDSAITEFNKIISKTNEKQYLAPANYYLGLLYNHKKEFDIANEYSVTAITLYEELNFKQLLLNAKFNYYYNNYQKGDYKIAKKGFLEFVNNHSDSDTLVDFNYLLSHKYLSKIYIKENNADSVNHYYDNFLFLYEKITDEEKKQFAEAYRTLENTDLKEEVGLIKKENINLKSDKTIITLILGLTIFIILIVFYLFILKKKKQNKKLLEIIENYNKKELENNTISNAVLINDDIELKIIEGLDKIEKTKYFLDKNFNLHNAAKKINTNTTYLSNFINNYKKMSFNDYTNTLRVDYIVKILIEDKKIRNYTTQALAEMLGYKNGASFSRIFKEKTGVTPILFINKLNEK